MHWTSLYKLKRHLWRTIYVEVLFCSVFVYYKLLTSRMREIAPIPTSLNSHSSSLFIPSLLKQRSYVRLLVSNIAFKLARRDSGKTKLSRLRTQGTKPSQTLSSIICPEIRNLVETHFFLISRWKITLFLVLNSILRH